MVYLATLGSFVILTDPERANARNGADEGGAAVGRQAKYLPHITDRR